MESFRGCAIKDLYLTEEQQGRLTLPAVDITRTATNTYEVLSHALPSEVVTTTTTPLLDDDGNPEFDFENNQLFDVETTSQKISWELRDGKQILRLH